MQKPVEWLIGLPPAVGGYSLGLHGASAVIGLIGLPIVSFALLILATVCFLVFTVRMCAAPRQVANELTKPAAASAYGAW